MAVTSIGGSAAIVGAGMAPLVRRSNRSVLAQAREASLAALEAAGVAPSQVDGVATYSMYGDSVAAETLGGSIGARELTYVMDFAQGGQSAAHMVAHAAMAIHSGFAETIVVFRALNGRSGVRIGRQLTDSAGTEFRYPSGYIAYAQYVAMWAQRYLLATGQDEHALAAVAMAERRWAMLNERAILHGQPLSEDDYFASPYIAKPFRLVDCTIEVDGAAAIVVTTRERAKDLKLRPVVVQGAAWVTRDFDLDMGSTLQYADQSRNYCYHLADNLWKSAGLTPADVDVAGLYDCFTGVYLQNLEGLGFCGYGEGGDFVARGETSHGGNLPVNPNGGLLAEGYLHGMNTVTEIVWQLQGLSGERQVAGAEVGAVCSGATHSGSAVVLVAER